MNTYLDSAILVQFWNSFPTQFPDGNECEIEKWNTFWTFIKKETNLFISSSEELNSIFVTKLSSGRGDYKIEFHNGKSNKYFRNKVNNKSPHSFYCLSETNLDEKNKYIKKNGYLIGFQDDFLEKWKDLKLLERPKILPVREGCRVPYFSSWQKLDEYLTPFTDLVLVDNYIFSDESMITSNFEQIITQFDKSTPVKYNLTIITFEGGRFKLNGQKLYDDILELKMMNNWKCKIGLVLSTQNVKEHDRGIFTNYIRIVTGDSFNYFDSMNKIRTHTDITFRSLANPDESNSAIEALSSIGKIIKYMVKHFEKTHVFGDIKNDLIDQL
ncbi:hypothetical protein [Mangrovibacterium diazotrophicum]|uniref:Uncharacterized protein n=1 Tax=Mangrovibacterium diazotrophicum TaxID=1261403 RepID=A0A419W3F8_9BACT|nr:hypothetical protein [Mangrovibacterium diazotrophicum]RKD90016.1 hypothetical protein BC643_0352 [Mangrovibacterium diazotrophicum]